MNNIMTIDEMTAELAVEIEEDVTTPFADVPRKFLKAQPAGLREFNVNGPKAEAVFALLAEGGHSRKAIATTVGCSVARVGEVVWAIQSVDPAFKVA